jgi:opacity protein-like surface antigen
MFKSSLVALLVASSLVATTAKAEDKNFYIGVAGNSNQFSVSGDTSSGDAYTKAFDGESKSSAELRAGYWFLKSGNFAMAADLSIGPSDMSVTKTVLGNQTKLTYKSAWALSAKAQYNFSESFGAYASLGIGDGKYTVENCVGTSCSSSSTSDTAALFGLGIAFKPTDVVELDLGFRMREGVTVENRSSTTNAKLSEFDLSAGTFYFGANYRF